MSHHEIIESETADLKPVEPSSGGVGKSNQEFYVAHIVEEKGGRPVQGLPIRILGACPNTMGGKVGQLIKNRYLGADLSSLELQARTRIASVLLASSYIVIYFKFPSEGFYYPTRSKAFMRFACGLRSELKSGRVDRSVLHRRRKANFLTASASL